MPTGPVGMINSGGAFGYVPTTDPIADSATHGFIGGASIKGTLAQRPPANSVPPGTFFVSSDTNTLYVTDGTAWTALSGGGGGGLSNAFAAMSDGTNTASAVGGDTFRYRSDGSLNITVTDNDPTYGDNAIISIANTSVVAATYGDASHVGQFTVNAQGRLTAATSVAIVLTSGSISDFTSAVETVIGNHVLGGTGITVTYSAPDTTVTNSQPVPNGGTTGQVLTKNSNANQDTGWATPSGGGGSPTTTRGDMIARGATVDQRLPIGSAAMFLGTDGTDPIWRRAPYIYEYDAGATAWSNDATVHSTFASIPAFPVMAVGDMLRLRGALSWLNNSGASQTLTVTLKNGGVTLAFQTSAALGTAANPHRVAYEFIVVCKTVGNAGSGVALIIGTIWWTGSTAAVIDTVVGVTSTAVGGQAIACATDGSGGNLDIQANMSTSTATSTVTPSGTIAEYWTKY